MARALALSRETGAPSQSQTSAGEGDFNDPEFVSQLLGTSDPNDPLVQAALAQLRSAGEPKSEPNEKKRKKEDE